MEKPINIIITTRNQVDEALAFKGKLMAFTSDGDAIVVFTEGKNSGRFRKVNLRDIQYLNPANEIQ